MANNDDDIGQDGPQDGSYSTGVGRGAPPIPPVPEPEDSPLDKGTPAVSSAPGRVLMIVVIFIVVVGYMLFSLFDGDDKKEKQVKEPQKELPVPAKTGQVPVPPPPSTTPPPPPPPPVLPPPPPPPSSSGGKSPVLMEQQQDNKERMARLKSDILVKGSGSGVSKAASAARRAASPASDDPNSAFSQMVMQNSGAQKSEATRMDDLSITIAQGKVIDAVLETAINTDLPGTLRAIVSRDIYAESGKSILITKGSRLIGTYNTGILRGQRRVFIVWTRLIRPDGVDIEINSEAIDQLGRAGAEGLVDNKYTEIISSAVLFSTITFGIAAAAESMVDDPNVSRRSFSDGTSERSGSPSAQASMELVDTLGTTGRGLVEDFIDIRPTITIDQGTIIKVFVNRDLIFPRRISSSVTVIK